MTCQMHHFGPPDIKKQAVKLYLVVCVGYHRPNKQNSFTGSSLKAAD